MSKINAQTGFSLIELLIATTLMVVVFTAFGAFMLGLSKTSAEISEVEKVNETVELALQRLRGDLDDMGTGLTMPLNRPYTGKSQIGYLPHPDYSLLGNSDKIRRDRVTDTSLLGTDVIFRGKSYGSIVGTSFSFYITDKANNSVITITRLSGLGGDVLFTITAIDGSTTHTESSRGGNLSGEVGFKYEPVVVGGVTNCVTSIFSNQQLLRQISETCTDGFKELSFTTNQNMQLEDLELYASEIKGKNTVSNSTPVELPLYPLWRNSRFTYPLNWTTDGFVVIKADPNLNTVFVDVPQTFNSSQTQKISVNDASGLAVGDVIFVYDISVKKSLVGSIASKTANNLTLNIINSELASKNYGYEHLYSQTSDYSSHTFGVGSKVVRLQPPIEWRLAFIDDSYSQFGILRRDSNQAWQMVYPNATYIDMRIDSNDDRTYIRFSMGVKVEGYSTQADRQEVFNLELLPRSLNRTFDMK